MKQEDIRAKLYSTRKFNGEEVDHLSFALMVNDVFERLFENDMCMERGPNGPSDQLILNSESMRRNLPLLAVRLPTWACTVSYPFLASNRGHPYADPTVVCSTVAFNDRIFVRRSFEA